MARALSSTEVVQACARWCDVAPREITAAGVLRKNAQRARRLACLVLRADGRSLAEIVSVLGFSARHQVTYHSDRATVEDRLDAETIASETLVQTRRTEAR